MFFVCLHSVLGAYIKIPVNINIYIDVVMAWVMAWVMACDGADKKIVGMYCIFSPQEISLAADAISVSLCGTTQEPIGDAERELPRNLCPLIKSSYGYAIIDTCPYFYFSDILLAETTVVR